MTNCSFCAAHLVYGLGDGGLHEINVTNNLRRKCVPQVLMELSIFQVVCSEWGSSTSTYFTDDKMTLIYIKFWNSGQESFFKN